MVRHHRKSLDKDDVISGEGGLVKLNGRITQGALMQEAG